MSEAIVNDIVNGAINFSLDRSPSNRSKGMHFYQVQGVQANITKPL